MNVILCIGKTNVGKSSLLNRMIGERFFVVGDIDNLTNDVVRFKYGNSILFDSPGISSSLNIEDIVKKIGNIDKIMVVVDLQSDLFLEKKILAHFKDKECILVINKSDLIKNRTDISLPSVETMFVSTFNGTNIDKLRNRLEIDSAVEAPKNKHKWSIFGRSNVGKSTLGNAFAGKEQFKVVDEIGTTRDISEFTVRLLGKEIDLIDTPGYRKNNAITPIEKASQYRLEDHMHTGEFSTAIMVIDALEGITNIDKHMIGKILESYFLVICINKIDLVKDSTLSQLKKELSRLYDGIDIVCISASKKEGLKELTSKIKNIEKFIDLKLKTSFLNKWLRSQIDVDYIKYMTQTGPFRFSLFSKKPVNLNKVRFLEKSLSHFLGIKGIRIKFEVVCNKSELY